jgi:hypothetical protein
MGYNLFDVLAAQGQYLTTNVDPRVAPGLDYAFGTVVNYVPKTGLALVLQKQSALGTAPTNWVPIPGTGGGGGVTSINTLTGAILLAPGSGITLTPVGNTITIAATGGGSAGYVATGTILAPVIITAAGGVTPSASPLQQQYVASSGGGVAIIAAPQIKPGTAIGQKLILIGTSNANYPIFDGTLAGSGISTQGQILLVKDQTIEFDWNGSYWNEAYRRD